MSVPLIEQEPEESKPYKQEAAVKGDANKLPSFLDSRQHPEAPPPFSLLEALKGTEDFGEKVRRNYELSHRPYLQSTSSPNASQRFIKSIQEPDTQRALAGILKNTPMPGPINQIINRTEADMLAPLVSHLLQNAEVSNIDFRSDMELIHYLREGTEKTIANISNWFPILELELPPIGKHSYLQVQHSETSTLKNFSKTATLQNFAESLLQQSIKLNELMNKAKTEPDNQETHLREAAQAACAALDEILVNQSFRRSLKLLADVRKNKQYEFVNTIIIGLEEILEKVHRLLIKAGFSKNSAEELRNGCRAVFKRVQRGETTRHDMAETIGQMRHEACKTAKNLGNRQIKAEKKQKLERLLKGTVAATTGAAMMALSVVNGANGNLNPTEVAVATTFAAGLISTATTQIWD